MRGPQIKAFAEKHKLKQISVAELIAYRQAREKLVERVGEFTVETAIGTLKGYAYVTPFDKVHHMALVHGSIGDGADVPTRLHRANVIADMFGGAKSVNAALARFKQAGRGVIVVLRDGTAGVPTQALPQDGETAAEAARTRQWREVGLGAQILKDLGVRSIRLLSIEPAHLRRPRRVRDRDHRRRRGWRGRSKYHLRQPERDLRDGDDEAECADQHEEERHRAAENLVDGGFGRHRGFHGEHHHAERRGELAELDRQDRRPCRTRACRSRA